MKVEAKVSAFSYPSLATGPTRGRRAMPVLSGIGVGYQSPAYADLQDGPFAVQARTA